MTRPAHASFLALTSGDARLFVRAWLVGFVVVLLLIG